MLKNKSNTSDFCKSPLQAKKEIAIMRPIESEFRIVRNFILND